MAELSIVSYLGKDANGPRAIRTRILRERLSRDWTTELIAASPGGRPRTDMKHRNPKALTAVKRLHKHVLLDRLEPWAWRNVRSRLFASDAALLIGLPFSTVAYASRAMEAASIPYVLDLGDFVVLGVPEPATSGIGLIRARRWERRMMSGASGVVVAVEHQREAILAEFPNQRVLVRPNGYEDVALSDVLHRTPGSDLRLAHIGSIYEARIDLVPFLTSLAASGLWKSVTLVQIGRLEESAIGNLRERIRIEALPAMPIHEAYDQAMTCDVALVIGNRHGLGVPSKTIQYLHLPLPRVALVADGTSELARFVSGRDSWIAIPWDSLQPAVRVRRHVGRNWSPEALAPPRSESWGRVADQIAEFVAESVGVNFH